MGYLNRTSKYKGQENRTLVRDFWNLTSKDDIITKHALLKLLIDIQNIKH